MRKSTLQSTAIIIMTPVIFGIIACCLYVSATLLRILQLRDRFSQYRPLLLISILLGLLAHGFSLYGEMFTESGISLRLPVMGSLIALVMILIILVNSIRHAVDNLFIIVLPVSAAAIWSSHFGHYFYVARPDLDAGLLSHIVFSVLAYSIITIAACQAVLLYIQDKSLRHFSMSIVKSFPPLMTMEALLFQFLMVGLSLLTFSIISGFLFLENIREQRLVHHTIITILAWITFSVLVWGRYKFGWRGGKAAKWTISGFALLLLGYFGSKYVIEIILLND